MTRLRSGGGWSSVAYSFQKARESDGLRKMWKAMRSRNACKTCALGMGGQEGGMVNEAGRFPEVCKKSLQAMASDMQPGIARDFWSRHSASDLQQFSPRELESSGRLVDPVRYNRESGRFDPIDWASALTAISDKLRSTPANKSFWYFSGRSSNEAGFLLQLFARLYGTNNVNNCSYYCHQASGVGLAGVIGSGTATIVLDDLQESDLVFVIGANPASNHPRLISSLAQLRRRGGNVIVINPIREVGLLRFRLPSDVRSLLFADSIASMYVQPHIGSDLALFHGIAKKILEMNAHDETFLRDVCSGWNELREHLMELSWDYLTKQCGVSLLEIEQIADQYRNARRVVFCWAMGITHHRHGTDTVQAIANLALMRAMVGKKGCGLMPIRGHSNVQGIGSMGVTPRLKASIFEQIEKRYDIKLPTTEGCDTMACMEGAYSGDLNVGFCLGGNLYGSNPDASFARRALSNLDLLVYVSTTLNTGHAWGLARDTIILPALARDEEPQSTTQESMFNYVRLSDGGPARHEGPRSEIDIVSTLAQQTLSDSTPVDWTHLGKTRNIRQIIAQVVPGYDAIAGIDDSKKEFQIAGRTFHSPSFATEDGRANLQTHAVPEMKSLLHNELRLMTIRSEGQFNTVVYEEADLYRGIDGRDVILMHPEDLSRMGLINGDRVTVHGPAESMNGIRATSFASIKPGNAAMYFPEANQLLDRTVDERSKTPAFRGAVVSIEKATNSKEADRNIID